MSIDLNFHFDAYEGERKTLKAQRDKLQEQLEKMKSDLKPFHLRTKRTPPTGFTLSGEALYKETK